MKVKNLKIKPKLVTMILTGAIASTTLVGCGNMKFMDNQFGFNKAVIFGKDEVLILDVYEYIIEYDMKYKIILNDGTCFICSASDTKLVNEVEQGVTAEEIAKGIMGEDVQINYLKTKIKKK